MNKMKRLAEIEKIILAIEEQISELGKRCKDMYLVATGTQLLQARAYNDIKKVLEMDEEAQ